MQIDIRKPGVDAIVFAEEFGYKNTIQCYCYQASQLTKSVRVKGAVNIKDICNGTHVSILSEQHAKDLIKALEKAIELGWFE